MRHRLASRLAVGLALSPAMLIVVVVYVGCTAWTMWISLTASRMLPNSTFVGLRQYASLMGNERWQVSVVNLAVFTLCLHALGIDYRVSAVIDGVRRDLVIDRMFEDLAETWIVDYKTSSHEGADLERFLAGEQDRYRGQLDRYAVALGKEGSRRGLYFPLLKGWRQWTSNEGEGS